MKITIAKDGDIDSVESNEFGAPAVYFNSEKWTGDSEYLQNRTPRLWSNLVDSPYSEMDHPMLIMEEDFGWGLEVTATWRE